MKAAWYTRNGEAADVLEVGTLPTPEPGPGEVRVRVKVSGVNPSDVKSRRRRPPIAPRIVPHSDGAGIVEAVGAGVDAARVGERVWLWNGQWQRPSGTAAQFIVLPEAQAVPLPDAAGFDEGACIGIPVLTALQALRLARQAVGVLAGRELLVIGGGSVVGHYVTQLAAQAGARVIATAGSPARQALAREAGAEAVIDHRRENVAERLRTLTGNRGVDAIIDMDFQSSAALIGANALRPHGALISYGSNDPGDTPVDFRPMLWNSLRIVCFLVYELLPADRRAVIGEANDLLARRALRHVFAERFALERIAEAHQAVEGGQRLGVVLVEP